MIVTKKIGPFELHSRAELYPQPAGTGGPKVVLSLKVAGDMGPSGDRFNPNRTRLYREMGIDGRRVYGLRQVHSTEVFFLDELRDEYPEGDGLITDSRGDILAVTVADCLPIFLIHRSGLPFAALHSGWKGTGIVSRALELLEKRYRCRAQEFSAVIEPGFGICCYRVDEERAEYFRQRFGEDTVVRREGFHLDLRKANISLLARHGVEDVVVIENCTACTAELSSFRREGPSKFSRMIALIGYMV